MVSTVGYMQIMKSFLSLRVSTLIDLTCLLHLLLDGWMDGWNDLWMDHKQCKKVFLTKKLRYCFGPKLSFHALT